MKNINLKKKAIIQYLQRNIPNLLAIYAFGSQIQDTVNSESDLDLSVLVAGYVDPVKLWELSDGVAEIAGMPVDLLDFRAASTVMQYQILMHGERWWALGTQAGIYEAAVLSEKTTLDEARAGLLQDIETRGSVYGG